MGVCSQTQARIHLHVNAKIHSSPSCEHVRANAGTGLNTLSSAQYKRKRTKQEATYVHERVVWVAVLLPRLVAKARPNHKIQLSAFDTCVLRVCFGLSVWSDPVYAHGVPLSAYVCACTYMCLRTFVSPERKARGYAQIQCSNNYRHKHRAYSEKPIHSGNNPEASSIYPWNWELCQLSARLSPETDQAG